MRLGRAILALSSATVLACSSADPPATGDPAAPPPDAVTCAEGWSADAGGQCAPDLPSGPCAPGTMPTVGKTACASVGTTACHPGFAPHASGWGCAAVAPSAACSGATREALGQTACAPVGDCAAPFPPAGATHFVDAAYGAGELDATHFRTISAALSAAPVGAVIAVHDGTYAESLTISRGVRVVGRCAAKVTLSGNGRSPGVAVLARGVGVSGLTLSGHATAVGVRAADAEIADVVIEGGLAPAIDVDGRGASATVRGSVVRGVAPRTNGISAGLFAGAGAKVTLTSSTISGAPYAGVLGVDAGTQVEVEGSVVRDGTPDDQQMGGAGVYLFDGAAATVTRSWLHHNRRAAVMAFAKSRATVKDSLLDDTQPPARAASTEAFGHGLAAFDTGALDVENTTVRGNVGIGLRLTQNATGNVRSSVVHAQQKEASGDLGTGAYVHVSSKLTVSGTAFVENHRTAIEAFDDGTEVDAKGCLFGFTRASLDGKQGLGFYLQHAVARVEGSAFTGNLHTGIYLWEARSFSMSRSVVQGTKPQESPAILGHGLLVQGVPSVSVAGSVFRDNAGVGLVFSDATASVSGSFVARNAVGIHAQDGSILQELPEVTGLPDAHAVAVDAKTRFDGNGAKVGSGVVPLASPLEAR